MRNPVRYTDSQATTVETTRIDAIAILPTTVATRKVRVIHHML